MKKKWLSKTLAVLLAAGMLLGLSAVTAPQAAAAGADTVIPLTDAASFASDGYAADGSGRYANNTFTEWDYTSTQYSYLKLTFAANSVTEKDWDYVTVVTEAGAVFSLTNDFSGKVITVAGSTFRLVFTSDGSTSQNGFSVAVTAGSAADVPYGAAPADVILPSDMELSNFISNVRGLDGAYCLKSTIKNLTLTGQNLTEMPDLSPYISLETLDLSDNEITTLDGVTFPAGLTGLTLSDNKIATLDGVTFPAGLEWLDLYNNRITSIDGVTFPAGLSSLSLYGNRITSIDGATFPTAPKYLDLEKNNLPFSAKDAIYAQLSAQMKSGQVYIGFQGPVDETTAGTTWFGYHNKMSAPDLYIACGDGAFELMAYDTEYAQQPGTYWISYRPDGSSYEDVFVKLGEAEAEKTYAYDAGDTGIVSALAAANVTDNNAVKDTVSSAYKLSAAKVADSGAILSFTTGLTRTDTVRSYDFENAYDDDVWHTASLAYTDEAQAPAALTSGITGVTMKLPISAEAAAKKLTLTADGTAVSYTQSIENGQYYLTFTASVLGTYRLTGVDTSPKTGDSGAPAMWLLLAAGFSCALAVTLRRKKED